MTPSRPRAFALFSLAALACASPKASSTPATPGAVAIIPASNSGQLARFGALRVMVLPTQGTWGGDSLGWRAKAGSERALLDLVDRSIEAAFGERGLASQWIFPPALERSAKRNPMHVTDPYAMRALVAIRAALRKPKEPIGEPFASQMRALAGISDSRFAFVPIDLRIDPLAAGGGRAVLRAAVFDSRGSELVWLGEVASDGQREYSETLFSNLAQYVADLVVPR